MKTDEVEETNKIINKPINNQQIKKKKKKKSEGRENEETRK